MQQSTTAYPLVFLMVLSSDHISPATGLSPTVTISKNGAAFASPSGAVSEIGSGWYKVAGNATDTGTLGPLLLHATAGTADPTDACYPVIAYNPQDAVHFGLSALPNTACTSNASLITSGSGTDQLTVSGGIASSDAKKINAVSTSSVTTINANIGTTQPTNFTGTGASALVKADTEDWGGVAVGGMPNSTTPPTAAAIATTIWQDLTSSSDFTTANSIGKLLVTDIDTNIGSRLATSGYTAPPTTAQIATGVWQDATAGDFTVASSIGKSLYTSGVVPGAAGGLFIAGSNAATTVNFTGNLSGSVGSVTGAVGSVTGAVGSVTAAVTITMSQVLAAPRALDSIADGSIQLNDALWAAVGGNVGQKDASSGTSETIKTPSTGTLLRTLTLTTVAGTPASYVTKAI